MANNFYERVEPKVSPETKRIVLLTLRAPTIATSNQTDDNNQYPINLRNHNETNNTINQDIHNIQILVDVSQRLWTSMEIGWEQST